MFLSAGVSDLQTYLLTYYLYHTILRFAIMSLVATTNTTTSGSIGTFGNTIVGKNQDATCYVGNFDERVTDSMVWELFLQVAPVVSLHIPRDRLNQTH